MYSSQVLLPSLTLTELFTAAFHVTRGNTGLTSSVSSISVVFTALVKLSEFSNIRMIAEFLVKPFLETVTVLSLLMLEQNK